MPTPCNDHALSTGSCRDHQMHIACTYPTATPTPTDRVLEIASMFGLGIDQKRTQTVVPPCTITLRAGDIAFVTGPSGSGKSTVLRLVEDTLPAADVMSFDSILDASIHDAACQSRPLVDQIGTTLLDGTRLLSLAGLADAFVMLRKPCELSDGQRYRFVLAHLMDQIERNHAGLSEPTTSKPTVILADEFGAALDRQTACLIARNVRRWMTPRTNACLIVATTHDDLLESLQPNVLIHKPFGSTIDILYRDVECKDSAYSTRATGSETQ